MLLVICFVVFSSCKQLPLGTSSENSAEPSGSGNAEISSESDTSSASDMPVSEVPIKEAPPSEPRLYPVYWEENNFYGYSYGSSRLIGFLDETFTMVVEPRYTSYSPIPNPGGSESGYYTGTNPDASFDVIDTNGDVVLSSEEPLSPYDFPQKIGDYLVYSTEKIDTGDRTQTIYNISKKTEINFDQYIDLDNAYVGYLGSVMIAVDSETTKTLSFDTETGAIKTYDNLNIASTYGSVSGDLMSATHTNDLSGYLSYSGGQLEWAIEPRFGRAENFNGDYAIVTTHEGPSLGSYRIIDKQGNIVASAANNLNLNLWACSTKNMFYDIHDSATGSGEIIVYDHKLNAVWGPCPGYTLYEDENGYFTVNTEYDAEYKPQKTIIYDGEKEITVPYEFYLSERLKNGYYLGSASNLVDDRNYIYPPIYTSENLILNEDGEIVERSPNTISVQGDYIWKRKGSVQGYTDLDGNWYYRESAYKMLMD